jgi:hypothetical protein
VLRDVLGTGGRPLLVVVVAREGLIRRRGHGGCEQRGCDYISAPIRFVMRQRAFGYAPLASARDIRFGFRWS